MATKTFSQKMQEAEKRITASAYATMTAGQQNSARAIVTGLAKGLAELPESEKTTYKARVTALRGIVGASKESAAGNASSVDSILAADWSGLSIESLRAKRAWATMAAGTLPATDPRRQQLLDKARGVTRETAPAETAPAETAPAA